MNGSEYQTLTLVKMQQRKWKTARELQNGNMVIPAGIAVEIVAKRDGLTLLSAPCAHCGVQVYIRNCSADSVMEVK